MALDEKFEVRFSLRKLLIGLLLTVVPISLLGLYSITESRKSLERTIGHYFKTIAEGTAAETTHFITDRVLDVGLIAAQPGVIDAVIASNRSYQGMSDADITAKIEKIDKTWNTRGGFNRKGNARLASFPPPAARSRAGPPYSAHHRH